MFKNEQKWNMCNNNSKSSKDIYIIQPFML